ncbi:MAG: hypothetical protein PHD51_03190 [Patescibacteria group bacterium]|nr:hypothetical protein [Patescibacteria group bacterium]MDD5491012.1 hypothetical protein [Patescibacteria group bacterium]
MGNKWMTQDWTTGDLNALVKNLGGEKVARKIQRGEVKVMFKDVMEVFFDKHGRRIPNGLQARVRDADREFQLVQPKLETDIDYLDRLKRLHEGLNSYTKITGEQFKAETERLLVLIRSNPQVANITKGIWLPVVLPRLTVNNLGVTLKQYLEAVGKSYTKTFSDRRFCNICKGTLAGEVNIVPRSRHDQLIERMEQGPVVGLHFPNPLQGFSIDASREQMSVLPEWFFLSGIDTPIAMVMYPDILARDFNTPGLYMAALSLQSTSCSLYFKADKDELDFAHTPLLASVNPAWASGLLFLGPANSAGA